jgi:hypothetical protein
MVKGIAQVIDALAGIAIIVIFVLGSMTVIDGQQWDNYQNTISAQDLGYTLERSGLIKNYVGSSDFGDIKSIVEAASEDTIEASLAEINMPKKTDIGLHIHKEEIERLNYSRPDFSDACLDNPGDEIIPESDEPVVSTNLSSGNLMDRTGVQVYLGQLEREESRFGSDITYNALWVENESSCDFHGPYFLGDNFYWGDKGDSKPGGTYHFYKTNTTSTDIRRPGTLEVHEADYIRNISDQLEKDVAGFSTYTDFDTFKFSDNFDGLDVLIFRNASKSIKDIEDNPPIIEKLKDYLDNQGNILFQANLDGSAIQNKYSETLQNLAGLKWFDREFEGYPSASCDLNSQSKGFKSDCRYEVSFPENRPGLRIGSIFENDLSGSDSDISLPVNHSIYSDGNGPISANKPVYLKNYHYSGYRGQISKDNLDTVTSGYPGETLHGSTGSCKVHSGQLDFFPSQNDKDREIAIIPIVDSSGTCGDRYIAGIEGKTSKLYSDGEKVILKGVEFEVNIIDSEQIIFESQRIPNISPIKFNRLNSSYPKIGLTGYKSRPENYTKADYKLLASSIYYLSLPHASKEISNSDETTETVGSIGSNYRPYRIKIGWNW